MRWLVVAIVGLASGALARTAAPGPVPPPGGVALVPGERMDFELHIWGLLVGRASIAIGPVQTFDGRRAAMMTSHASTAGVVRIFKRVADDSTTVIDLATGRPLAVTTSVEERGTRTTTRGTFTGTVARVTYMRSKDSTSRESHFDFHDLDLYDTQSAMVALRSWRAAPGTRRTVYIVGGQRLWRCDVTFLGIERISTALGPRVAAHIAGKVYRARADFSVESRAPSREFSVWIGTDAQRLPLQLVATTELGHIVMKMTRYTP